MDSSIKVKIKIKGKCLILSLNEDEPIESIITNLKSRGILETSIVEENLDIMNGWTREQLHYNVRVSKVTANEKLGFRDIEVMVKNAPPAPLIENVEYEEASQMLFKNVCDALLNNDQEQLLRLQMKGKISASLLSTILKLKLKIKAGGDNIQQMQKQIEKQKLTIQQQNQKLNKLMIQIKQAQTKFAAKNQQFEKLKKENDAKFALKVSQIDTIKGYLKKMAQEEESKIIENQPKLSGQSLKAINNLIQQWNKKLAIVNEKYQQITHDKESLQNSLKQSKKKIYPLLYKSKTFQLQHFKSYLDQGSENLRNYIEDYAQNVITQIQSHIFMEGNNSGFFINSLKGKRNFVLLFSSEERLFGIFSTDIFGLKPKSNNGILFSLSSQMVFEPKPKQPIWKYSNVEIRIGNQSLIMAEQPTSKGATLKMRKKKPIKDSFDISDDQVSKLFGNADQILVNSFECLIVSFLHEQILEQSSISMSESVHLKTEESV